MDFYSFDDQLINEDEDEDEIDFYIITNDDEDEIDLFDFPFLTREDEDKIKKLLSDITDYLCLIFLRIFLCILLLSFLIIIASNYLFN